MKVTAASKSSERARELQGWCLFWLSLSPKGMLFVWFYVLKDPKGLQKAPAFGGLFCGYFTPRLQVVDFR